MRCVALVAAMAASTGGCSWLMTSRTPDGVVRTVAGPPAAGPPGLAAPPPVTPSACANDRYAPAIDTAIASMYFGGAALAAIGGTVVLAQEAGPDGDEYNRMAGVMFLTVAAVSALFATPWAYSARYGFRNIRACVALENGD